jgi:hypothetical protein
LSGKYNFFFISWNFYIFCQILDQNINKFGQAIYLPLPNIARRVVYSLYGSQKKCCWYFPYKEHTPYTENGGNNNIFKRKLNYNMIKY